MSDIDEFHVLFRAITAPFVEGVTAMTASSERSAAAIAAANTAITASTERMAMAARASMVAVGAAATGGSAAYQRMAASTVAASNGMVAASARASQANAALGASIASANASAAAASAAMTKRFALGAAGAALISGAAVHMAGDFEIATKRLISSAGETHEGMKIIQEGILDMAGQVGNTADELARASYVIASGGQHGADALYVLRAAAEGAAAEGADLYEVADAITSILADYHLEASKSAEVTSKMVAAVGSGKTTFQEFTSSLSAILPIASAAHISLDDISAAIASMTVHGMSARQASQNLADVVRHMVAPTQVQTKELGQLGMSSADLADKLGKKGLTGTLQEISQLIISKMGPSGKVLLDALNQSKEAARSADVMIGAMPKNLQSLTQAYRNGDITLQQWRKQLKGMPPEQANLLAQWASLENRAKGFNDILKSGSPAAQTYMDALRRATGDATGLNVALMLTGENTEYVNKTLAKVGAAHTEAGGHVMHWSEIQETFNNKLDRAKAAMGSLAIQVGEKLLPAVSTVVGWLANAAEWLSKHDTIATALAITLGVLTVGLTIATIALWAMNSALLANPITWIILLVVAFIAVWVLAFTKISWFHTAVMAYIHFWMRVPGYLRTAWDAVWAFFVGIGRWFRDDFAGFFIDAWHSITEWTGKAVDWLAAVPGKIADWFGRVVDWFQELPGRIRSGLAALPGVIAHLVSAAAHRFFYTIGFMIGTAVRLFLTLRHEIPALLARMWHAAVHAVAEGARAVGRWFVNLWHDTTDTVARWWHAVVAWVVNGVNGVIEWCRLLPGRAVAFFRDLYHGAVNMVTDMWHRVTSTVTNMINDAVAFLRALPGRARDAIHELPGRIHDGVSNAINWLYNAGQDVVRGALNGMRSMFNHAMDTIRGWGRDIARGFRDALGISSPSRVFAEAGHWIVAGLVQGIDATAHRAVAAVADLADSMTLAPSVAVSVGGGGARAGTGRAGTGGLGPVVGSARWRPPAPARPLDERPVQVEAVLHLDGREVYRSVIPYAQQHKGRNPSTALT